MQDIQDKTTHTPPVFLSICAIVRNEGPYIGEWIDFHRRVGVERFYLYDDHSTDDTLAEARRHAGRALVLGTYRYGSEWCSPVDCPFAGTHQVVTFNRFLHEHGDESEWVAYIDPDEYLYHRDHDDIRDPLYEDTTNPQIGALFVNWLVFGSNGHQQKPAGLTIESYTRRGQLGEPAPFGRHGKLIARKGALAFWGPFGSHNAIFRKPFRAVNETGQPVPMASTKRPQAARWRCNHYYHRSAAEAEDRVAAIDNNAAPGFHKTLERMRLHDLNGVEDREILRLLPIPLYTETLP